MNRASLMFAVLSLSSSFLGATYSQDRNQPTQDAPPQQQQRPLAVTSSYDRFRNVTFTQINASRVQANYGVLYFDAAAVAEGERANNRVTSVALFFYAVRIPNAPRVVQPNDETIYYIADGERRQIRADYSLIHCPEIENSTVGSYTCDSAQVQFSIEELARILDARRVEWRWGIAEFEIQPEGIEALRELLRRVRPSSTSR